MIKLLSVNGVCNTVNLAAKLDLFAMLNHINRPLNRINQSRQKVGVKKKSTDMDK